MIARKNALNPNNVAIAQAFAARAQLTQERNLAMKRQDYNEVTKIEQQIEALAAVQGAANGKPDRRQDNHADVMARVNERNRKANLEAVRKAEAEQAARKRQERKAAAAAGVHGFATLDVSARVKTVPKIHHQSRLVAHTLLLRQSEVKPIIGRICLHRTGTPIGTPTLNGKGSAERSVSPLAPPLSSSTSVPVATRPTHSSFEARVIESINIDLDDF